MFFAPIVLFAFLLGVTLSLASTCSVAATKRWVISGKPDWLVGIGYAVCWSALTLFVLGLLALDNPKSLTDISLSWTLVVASVAMGVGAYINSACFIGSIGRIGTGEISFLATFGGLALARKIGEIPILDQPIVPLRAQDTFASNPYFYWVASAVFLLGAMLCLMHILRKRKRAVIALGFMGIFAAATFTLNPGWTYEDWVGRLINGDGLSTSYEIEFTILALFSGAILGSIAVGTFTPQRPNLWVIIRCLTGGLLMGLGAKFAPGGNDTLLLWVIPNYALYGLMAYAMMILTVAVLVHVSQRFKPA